MAGKRYNQVPQALWTSTAWPALKGIDQDLTDLETAVATGTGGGGVGTDITINQNTDGTWPTITRKTGAHYRWLCMYDATKWPTAANGAAAGDELVGADSSVVP